MLNHLHLDSRLLSTHRIRLVCARTTQHGIEYVHSCDPSTQNLCTIFVYTNSGCVCTNRNHQLNRRTTSGSEIFFPFFYDHIYLNFICFCRFYFIPINVHGISTQFISYTVSYAATKIKREKKNVQTKNSISWITEEISFGYCIYYEFYWFIWNDSGKKASCRSFGVVADFFSC